MYIKLGTLRQMHKGRGSSENSSRHPASSKARENWPGAWVHQVNSEARDGTGDDTGSSLPFS